jgi:antitoxin component YwqK of YwqJK toxin-antitoxin module
MKPLFFTFMCAAALSASAFNYAPGDTGRIDATGKKQGLWKEVRDGFEWYGMYTNDQRNGTWVNYHPGTNPNLVNKTESWVAGKRNGIYLELDRNGYLLSQKSYKNDSLDGVSTEFAGGAKPKSELTWHRGMLNGTKKLYNQENFKVQEEGQFVNGLREGIAKWYSLDGKVIIEYTYKHGQLDGKMKTYYKNGNTTTEGTYVNNDLQGEFFEYYEDGKPKNTGSYVKGKKEGMWKEYDEEGKMKQLKYKNDLPLK